jgi:hypothetical protein
MINLKNGIFKLDEYNLIIHPELTLSAFKASDIQFGKILSNSKKEVSFEFKAHLEKFEGLFQIYFSMEKLFRLRIYFDKIYGLSAGKAIEDWLVATSGESMPFEYEWGCLLTEADERSDNDFSILMKYEILALGFHDVESFYKLRRP